MGIYISTRRRHDEEAQQRREVTQSADELERRRGELIREMDKRGLSPRQKDAILQDLDRIIEHRRELAE